MNGRNLGQRGIDQLIDRGAMEKRLEAEGAKLSGWSATLDALSHDRADMLCQGLFHRAAWYFDPQDEEQLELAFDTDYACTKDICRNDETIDRIGDWLEQNSAYDRPLFHTVSLQDQDTLAIELSSLVSASYGVGTRSIALLENLDEWANRLHALEEGKLPDVAELPEGIRSTAILARENLTPAVSRGIARSMETLAQAMDGTGSLPPLEDIFRDLPKALGQRLMSAAREGGITFQLANEGEVTNFRRLLQQVLALRINLGRLNSQTSQLRDRRQHGTENYRYLEQEKRHIQQRLTPLEEQLARAISPVEELP